MSGANRKDPRQDDLTGKVDALETRVRDRRVLISRAVRELRERRFLKLEGTPEQLIREDRDR